MKLNESNGKVIATYAVILGVMYFALGLLEFIGGLGGLLGLGEDVLLGFEWIPVDLYGGFATLVIGAAYLGSVPLWNGKYESLSYLLAGALLSAVYGILYILLLGANGFGAYLAGELSEWEWMIDLSRPEIWLFILSIPLGIFGLKATKAK